MADKLEKEHLQTFTIKTTSVIWLKKNKELLLNGEPFDVKTISLHGNYIIVSGLFDHDEKRVVNGNFKTLHVS